MVGNDLSQFFLDVLRVDGLTANPREGSRCVFQLPFLHVKPRRLWQEHQTNSKNQGPKELNGDRDPVASGIEPLLG